MTLENFFALTEMKDGLTAPGRVEELVSLMQEEKDNVVKNIGEATRQWSTVASTIAATENKDCLDLFIQLDGLCFIKRWLDDAQKFGNDTSDKFVEESITSLLGALEKLHIDNERSISSGIWNTVKSLLQHNSSRVQERARTLSDSWQQGRDTAAIHNVEEVGEFHGDDETTINVTLGRESGLSECCAVESKESTNDGISIDSARDEILPSSSEGREQERVEDMQIETCNNHVRSLVTSDHTTDIKDKSLDTLDSCDVLNHVQENIPTKEESLARSADGTTSVETCSSPVIKAGMAEEGKSDASKLNEFTDKEKQTEEIKCSPEPLAATEIPSASCTLEPRVDSSSADAANGDEIVAEPALQSNNDTVEGNVSLESDPVGDARTLASEETSGNEGTSGSLEVPTTSFSQMGDIGTADEEKEHASDGSEELTHTYKFSEPAMNNTRGLNLLDKRSDIELEYGIVDALEVARQVAKEVEREVDYRDPLYSSSSEKISERLIRQEPGSPDSINGKHNQCIDSLPKEAQPAGQNLLADASEGHFIRPDNQDQEPENCIHDMESSQVTEAAAAHQEPEVTQDKGAWLFDLNQEISSEVDMDLAENFISAPVSVVSASRAAAAPGLPVAPLQFEGALGWKGSAATSAFRPASKTVSLGGSSSSPKRRRMVLDIDLNVAEADEKEAVDLIPQKHIQITSGLPSGESSMDASPRRSDGLNLDLNRISDDGDASQSDWRMEGRLFYQSPSPASSSSSMQPLLRNFDLNDRPAVAAAAAVTMHRDFPDRPLNLGKSTQFIGGFKPAERVISIMGKMVEVDRNPASDGNLARSSAAVTAARPMVSYANPNVFGYTSGPAMSFSPAMYGPGMGGSIPYMVDSRGAPVVPQFMGSGAAMGIPPSYTQSPFMMSMAGAPPSGFIPGGSSRPNFDLNSGFVIEGGNNRDLGCSRQVFTPIQGERQFFTTSGQNSQPSSSGKRKEPDGGWETYPFNLKHHRQPPWN